jgi:hypothetical protein
MAGYPEGAAVVATGEVVLRAFAAVGEDVLPDGE